MIDERVFVNGYIVIRKDILLNKIINSYKLLINI